MDHEQITRQAFNEFDCVLVGTDSYLLSDPSEVKRRNHNREVTKKRERIRGIQKKFEEAYQNNRMPKSKEEAVRLFSPIAAFILGQLVKLFITKVIEWMYDKYASAESQSTVVGEGVQ